jgi:hypothetical protein
MAHNKNADEDSRADAPKTVPFIAEHEWQMQIHNDRPAQIERG